MLESIELVLARSRSGSSVKQSSTSTRVININSIHSTSQPQSQSSRQDQGHGQHENDEEASISVADSGNVDNDVTIINDTTFSFLACLERWWHIVAISAVITGLVVLWPTFGLGMKNKQVQENAYIEECEPGVKRSILRLRHEERKLKQQPSPSSSCSICGDGMRVGNPDASASFPGQAGQIPCGLLQNMGTVGLIPPPQCAVLPQLISTICECESTTPPTTTVPPTTTTEATKPASGKSGKSMSVSSKAAKAKSEIIKCNTTKSSKVNRK